MYRRGGPRKGAQEGTGTFRGTVLPDPGEDVPRPLETFRQPVKLGNPLAEMIPASYVLTIEPDAETDDFSRYAERAKKRKYNYLEWRTGHNP